MLDALKFNGALLFIVLVLGTALYVYQTLMESRGLTPEGFKILTPVTAQDGFDPETMPDTPVIQNRDPEGFGFAFGYLVRKIPFSYTMQMRFRRESNNGVAILSVRHAGGLSKVTAEVVRGWDYRRKTFVAVVHEVFDTDQAVPALCIKMTIGPKADAFDLDDGSICVTEREVPGDCRLETLACGRLR